MLGVKVRAAPVDNTVVEVWEGTRDEHSEAESAGAPQPVAPYRRGDRISVVSPEGIRFVAKVETVTPRATGEFAILAAIREPRRYRSTC